MNRLIHSLQVRATGKLVLTLFVITMGVYATILLMTIPAVQAQAPELPLFDVSPGGYSLEYATTLLAAIGESGRQIYLTRQLPLDFVYPGLVAVTYTLLLIWLFKQGFAAKSPIFYLAFVATFAGFFDYLENIGIILMLRSYPDLSATTVAFASINTILKSAFTTGFFLLLIVGLIAFIRKSLATRSRTAPMQRTV